MTIKAAFPCQHCGKDLKYEGEPVFCKCNKHIGHTLVVVPVHGPNIKVEEDFTDAKGR